MLNYISSNSYVYAFVDEKLHVCVYITRQFVMKQLPAGAISYSIDTALTEIFVQN